MGRSGPGRKEPTVPYNAHLSAKKDLLRHENMYCWGGYSQRYRLAWSDPIYTDLHVRHVLAVFFTHRLPAFRCAQACSTSFLTSKFGIWTETSHAKKISPDKYVHFLCTTGSFTLPPESPGFVMLC